MPGNVREVFVDIYADRGCKFAPSCLECPFEVCQYDRGFAGNRVSKAVARIKRDERIVAMRSGGMTVPQIALVCDLSVRTIARILERSGPSVSDIRIANEDDRDGGDAGGAWLERSHEESLSAMGVKARPPVPLMFTSQAQQHGARWDLSPVRMLYAS